MVRLTIQTYHLCNSFSFVSFAAGALLLALGTELGAVLGAVLGTAVPLLAADAAGDAEELSPLLPL